MADLAVTVEATVVGLAALLGVCALIERAIRWANRGKR